jgi:hypothetical protein
VTIILDMGGRSPRPGNYGARDGAIQAGADQVPGHMNDDPTLTTKLKPFHIKIILGISSGLTIISAPGKIYADWVS